MRSVILVACVVLGSCATDSDPEPPPEASSASPASSAGISRDDAIEIAREAVSAMATEWQVSAVTAGPLEQAVPEFESYEWARDLPTDLPVWRVALTSGELSALVVTDFMDGRVYGVVAGIAD